MELLILNREFELVDIVDVYESLIWTDRYSSYGDFEIYTSATTEMLGKFKQDYYLSMVESEHQMIIEEIQVGSDVETGNHLTITGRSLESLLTRRIVWKQTILNGDFQNAVKKLLNENVISPSDSSRKIGNFVFEESTDPEITKLTIRAQFTGDNLYDAIKAMCDAYNLGFKITLNEKNQFVFKLYSGADRSYSQDTNPHVVFSPEFENIINSNYLESKKDYKTVTLVAGEGEGSDRRTVTVGSNPGSGIDRREMYTDARDISSTVEEDKTLTEEEYNAQLSQRGVEKLSEQKVIQSFEGQVETTLMYRFGEHFFMGDITQLENEYGKEARVRVIEFIHCEDQNGIRMYPTFNIEEE